MIWFEFLFNLDKGGSLKITLDILSNSKNVICFQLILCQTKSGIQIWKGGWSKKNQTANDGNFLPLDNSITYRLIELEILVWFCRCGCGWRTFFVFKSLENNMVYSLDIGVYIHIYIFVHNKFLVGFIFSSSWKNFQLFSKSPC